MQEPKAKDAATARRTDELAGRTAIVTGSTSGIGLGIAQAFAASGMHVMLNGFGDKAEIQKIRADMEETYGIKTAYSAADMSKPDEIVRMVEDARKAARQGRRARQQRRHPARRGDRDLPRRQVGRDHRHRSVLGVPRHPRRGAGDEGPQVGAHHQHRLRARPRRLAVQVGLRRGQARHPRPDQDGGAGDGRARHHRQRHLPRLRAHAAGAEADPRDGQGARHHARSRSSRTCCCTPSPRASS